MAGIIKVNQYQDFNGNTLFTSDGNGNLTTMKTNYPAFLLKLNTNFAVANNTVVKIQYDNEIYDTDNAYDATTNYRFTVPSGKAGKYVFYHSIRANGWGAQRFVSFLRINGSIDFGTFEHEASSGSLPSAGNTVSADLSVGDYVEHNAYHNNGSTQNLQGTTNDYYTYFGGYRIGS